MKTRIILIVSIIAFLLPLSELAGQEKGQILPLSDILTIVAQEAPGKVVKAELKKDLYEVIIITTDGKEEKIYIDAIEGKIIEKATLSLDEATKIAIEQVPGQVIKVEFERGVYEFKIMSNEGNKMEVYIDSRSGEVLKVKSKDN